MTYRCRQNKGFLIADMIFGLFILGLILGVFGMVLNQFARFNHHQLVTQQCLAAGQGQLDSITMTGKAIEDEDFQRLWPKLQSSIEISSGQGQWEGLQLVKVTVRGKALGKEVNVKLSRYAPAMEKE